MNRRSSVATDGRRVWCMGSVWWKELSRGNKIEEMRPFRLCSKPVTNRFYPCELSN
uniref:Uncharacterized protein n=1 Tax=Nelumbo nucifera TaxID=4432 RepID=A0A822ZMX3_NELNU|nr:TPA_asm: hypothetical protein HUJ06_003101 [Nelumbo nucifera]